MARSTVYEASSADGIIEDDLQAAIDMARRHIGHIVYVSVEFAAGTASLTDRHRPRAVNATVPHEAVSVAWIVFWCAYEVLVARNSAANALPSSNERVCTVMRKSRVEPSWLSTGSIISRPSILGSLVNAYRA